MMIYNKKVYIIERKNSQTGFIERIQYTGSIKNKPKGWKIIKQIQG